MPRRTRAAHAVSPALASAPLVETIAAEVRAGRWEQAATACGALAESQPHLATLANATAEAAGRRDALTTVARLLRLAAASDEVARKAKVRKAA